MKVCLMHNQGAGDAVSVEFLRDALQKAGHELAHAVQNEDDLNRVLDDSIELLVVAGGDGTVRRAAIAVVGRGLPLGILPLGTANNIARSLGIKGTISKVIERWNASQPRPIDLGTVRGPWGESHFVEGIGTGLIPLAIRAVEAEPARKDESANERTRAAARYLEVLRTMHPRPIALTGDGLRLEHNVLMVEVLNIRSVGPNLVLSQAANPSDGLLTLLVAGPEHREALSHFLRCRVEGRRCRVSLPTWQVRWLVMSGCTELHVDDTVHEWSSSHSVSMCLGATTVPVLL